MGEMRIATVYEVAALALAAMVSSVAADIRPPDPARKACMGLPEGAACTIDGKAGTCHGPHPSRISCQPGTSPTQGSGSAADTGAAGAASGTSGTASGTGNAASGTGNAASGTGNAASGTGNAASGTGNAPSGTGNAASGTGNAPASDGNHPAAAASGATAGTGGAATDPPPGNSEPATTPGHKRGCAIAPPGSAVPIALVLAALAWRRRRKSPSMP